MKHRDDIQGLRGVAVLLVVLNHAGVAFLAGGFIGVDVFFVLSGYLITGLLLSGVRKRGFLSLGDFYARRARRILPAAGLTLVATVAASYLLLNFVRAKEYLIDAISAAFFVSNFRFADLGTDYFASTAPPSPIQQFWTLAVEEQFYIVWPVLLALLLGAAIRGGRSGSDQERGRWRLSLGVAVIVVASFAWSVHETQSNPTAAFFSSLGRAWELGLGAALALAAAPLSRLPARWLWLGGWAGLGAIAAAAVLYSFETPFPGVAALLPTLGTVLVILAGMGATRPRWGVDRLLTPRPLRYVGDRSYTFYLWHWPVLVIAAQYKGYELSVRMNLALLVVAFAISIVTYALFEDPIRRGLRSRPLSLMLWPAVTLVVVAVAGAGLLAIDRKEDQFASASAAPASVLAPPATGDEPLAVVDASVEQVEAGAPIPTPLDPSPEDLLDDRFYFEAGCTPEPEEVTSEICPLGDPRGSRSLVVFGDSKAQMWMTAIVAMAERNGWQVHPIVRSSCTPSGWAGWAADEVGPECGQWFDWAMDRIGEIDPDAVLVAGNYGEHTANAEYNEATAEGMGLALDAIGRRPSVVVIGDVPGQQSEPIDCLLAPGASMESCSTAMTSFQGDATLLVEAEALEREAGFVDPTGWVCAGGICPMVVDGTIAYADRSHLSLTYVDRLNGVFRDAVNDALETVKGS